MKNLALNRELTNNLALILATAIERDRVAKSKVVKFPTKVFAQHKDRCMNKTHKNYKKTIDSCPEHGDAVVCAWFRHLCLECEPHYKSCCLICGTPLWQCRC